MITFFSSWRHSRRLYLGMKTGHQRLRESWRRLPLLHCSPSCGVKGEQEHNLCPWKKIDGPRHKTREGQLRWPVKILGLQSAVFYNSRLSTKQAPCLLLDSFDLAEDSAYDGCYPPRGHTHVIAVSLIFSLSVSTLMVRNRPV